MKLLSQEVNLCRGKYAHFFLILCLGVVFLLPLSRTTAPVYAAGEQLSIGVLKGTQYFPIAAMLSKGLEKKYGLDLKVTPLASPAAIHNAITAHQVDVAFSTSQNIF